MQYLLYCVVFFKVRGTTKEGFMADVMDVTFTNHEVFTQHHTHDAKVASVWYKRANGIPSPSNNHTDSP
jgi:hypothetical protein